jgi:putative efflux protein, MATE family
MPFEAGNKAPAFDETAAEDDRHSEAPLEAEPRTETADMYDEQMPERSDRQIDIEVDSNSQRKKLIIALAWPSLAENFLTSLMSMMDMMMVGGLGAYAISAVGLVTQPRFIMLSAFMAMSVGTTALVARCKGARDPDGANNAFRQSLVITAILTAILCVVMNQYAEALLRWMAGTEISERTITEALAYFKIQIYGFPTLSFTFAINAALRGVGNTKASFQNNTVANVVNVILNYCLISGNFGFPRMEVAGASLATVIGQGVGMLLAIYTVASGRQYISLGFRTRWKLDFTMITRIMRIGMPALVEQVIMRVGILWFTTIVTALGELAYSAHMVVMNIMQLSFTAGMALGTAGTTLVGQCLGRGRADLAKIYVKLTQNIGYIVSVVIALVMFVFGPWLAGLYSDDVAIIGLAADMLKIIGLATPVSNARFVYVSALRGSGDSRYMAVIAFLGVLLVRPVVSLILVNILHMGLYGIFIAFVADIFICFLLSLARYNTGKWTQINV